MYKNVGKKIQFLSKTFTWMGIVLFAIVGALAIYGGLNTSDIEMIIQGLVLLVFLPISCWLFGLLMVGFGRVVDSSDKIKKQVEDLSQTINKNNQQ